MPGSWFEEQDPFSPVRYRYPIEEVLHRRTTPYQHLEVITDVITTDGLLPEITVGDRVVIPCAGAYTTAYASAFNGFPGPETIVVEAL